MRLDHLLSKEHLRTRSRSGSEATSAANDRRVGLIIVDAGYMQGFGLSGELVLSVRAWKGLQRVQGFLFGTLLGPERTRECFPQRETTGLSQSSNRRVAGRRGQGRDGVWLFFENCTVDASIFVASY